MPALEKSDPAASISLGERNLARPRISRPRIPVANMDGEEFEEAPRGSISNAGDERRQL